MLAFVSPFQRSAYLHTMLILHTLNEESSSVTSRTSLMVLPTALMTRSMTWTTPFVATWLPWMILAQFTVTIFKEREFCKKPSPSFGSQDSVDIKIQPCNLCVNWPHWSSGWCRAPGHCTLMWRTCRSSCPWSEDGGSPCGSEERCTARCSHFPPVQHVHSGGEITTVINSQ